MAAQHENGTLCCRAVSSGRQNPILGKRNKDEAMTGQEV